MNVFCFGDSLTVGYPRYDTYTDYLAEGSEGLLLPVTGPWGRPHFGVSGETTSKIKNRFLKYFKESRGSDSGDDEEESETMNGKKFSTIAGTSPSSVSCVVIQGGTNDLALDISPSQIVENLTHMCHEAIFAGLFVVLCTVPPASTKIESSNPGLAERRAFVNKAILDLQNTFPASHFAVYDFAAEVSTMVDVGQEPLLVLRDDLRCDEIHLTKAGYRAMGLGIAATVSKLMHR